jgi:hypothetical protein
MSKAIFNIPEYYYHYIEKKDGLFNKIIKLVPIPQNLIIMTRHYEGIEGYNRMIAEEEFYMMNGMPNYLEGLVKERDAVLMTFVNSYMMHSIQEPTLTNHYQYAQLSAMSAQKMILEKEANQRQQIMLARQSMC